MSKFAATFAKGKFPLPVLGPVMVYQVRRRGFTLLELLLVVAFILILSAAAYPTLSAMYGDVRLKAAADQVRTAWTEARSHAIEDGRTYRFAVQSGTGKFRVAPDGAEFWDGSSMGESEENALPPFIHEEELSSQIKFTPSDGGASGGGWTTIALFNPDGTCNEDKEISLQEDGETQTIVISVRAMTGAITVRTRSASEGK